MKSAPQCAAVSQNPLKSLRHDGAPQCAAVRAKCLKNMRRGVAPVCPPIPPYAGAPLGGAAQRIGREEYRRAGNIARHNRASPKFSRAATRTRRIAIDTCRASMVRFAESPCISEVSNLSIVAMTQTGNLQVTDTASREVGDDGAPMASASPADAQPKPARSTGTIAAATLDRRTRAWRRRCELVAAYSAAVDPAGIGGPTLAVRIAAAAEARTVAELARAAYLRGEGDVPLDDVVRSERLALSLERRLGLDKLPAKPQGPTLAEYLASKAELEAESA